MLLNILFSFLDRYLLLIDDVWSAKTWDSIRTCLPDENIKGSRIIVTTRFQVVGATCSQRDGTDYVHLVDILNDDDAKILFDQSVSESTINGESSAVPENIWKVCVGLPLAIVTMAGLVACNPTKSNGDWIEVCRPFAEQETSLSLERVTGILNCCYNDLHADVKTCLLYLSIFPKGWKISRKRIIRRWIAEGFVSEKQGLSEEGVAEAYFNQLTRRKVIRPVEYSSNGKVKTFLVHDMILEYIMSKSNEENFNYCGRWALADACA